MRSLRVFYADESASSGQLVIASRESQYKILHFHHGGLEKLEETFADWKFLTTAKNKASAVGPAACNCQLHFMRLLVHADTTYGQ